MFEQLEARRLFSTISVSGGVLTITGGNANNNIVVRENNGSVHVEDSGTPTDYTGITAININGGPNDDIVFYTGNSIGANISGLSGNDSITISDEGSAGSNVDAGGGDDQIVVLHANNTTLLGGGGSDQFTIKDSVGTGATWSYGLGGGDTFTTEAGTNHLFGGGGDDSVYVNDTSMAANGGTNYYSGIENVYHF